MVGGFITSSVTRGLSSPVPSPLYLCSLAHSLAKSKKAPVGGWVGGWVGRGGWMSLLLDVVGWWVGGWVGRRLSSSLSYLPCCCRVTSRTEAWGASTLISASMPPPSRTTRPALVRNSCASGWVGGWVGGWIGWEERGGKGGLNELW